METSTTVKPFVKGQTVTRIDEPGKTWRIMKVQRHWWATPIVVSRHQGGLELCSKDQLLHAYSKPGRPVWVKSRRKVKVKKSKSLKPRGRHALRVWALVELKPNHPYEMDPSNPVWMPGYVTAIQDRKLTGSELTIEVKRNNWTHNMYRPEDLIVKFDKSKRLVMKTPVKKDKRGKHRAAKRAIKKATITRTKVDNKPIKQTITWLSIDTFGSSALIKDWTFEMDLNSKQVEECVRFYREENCQGDSLPKKFLSLK